MKKSKFYSGKKVNRSPGLVDGDYDAVDSDALVDGDYDAVDRNPRGLVLVEYWKRDQDGWTLDWTRSGGSIRWAELLAADVLKPVQTTNSNYYRDMNRSDYVTVIPLGKVTDRFNIEPTIEIVPSVGEKGYW